MEPAPILLDVAINGNESFVKDFLERVGHPVAVCHGPAVGTLCPLLGDGSCDIFEQAHGIVFELDLDRPQHRAILRKYRDLAPEDMPIRAVVRPGQRERYDHLLTEIEVWDHRPSIADLDGFAAEVEAADLSH